MIKIPMLLDKELEIFKGKRVVLYTNRGNVSVKRMKIVFDELNLEVIGCYSMIQPSTKKKIGWKELNI